MRQVRTRASRPRLLTMLAAISVIALAASSPLYSAVTGSHLIAGAAAMAVDAKGDVYTTDNVGNTATRVSSLRTYRLRWPSRPNQSATYQLRFKSPHLRATSLRVYGIRVPRGFGFDFIVACEHRGPAVLSWNWVQKGGSVRITVKMTTGICDLSGPTVAGTYVTLSFQLVR